MANITPQLIKELRDRTGVGMGKCKEALESTQGDMENAIDLLRKTGMASAVKKEGRETRQGRIGHADHDQAVSLVEVNAETDFVVKNSRFQEFVEVLAQQVAQTQPASLESFLKQPYAKDTSLTVDEYRATLVQTIGENIQIRRVAVFKKSPDRSIGVYSHMGGQLVTLVQLAGSNREEALAREIAMHAAAAAPDYLTPAQVPAEVIEREKEIVRDQIKGKPAQIVDKIIEGKIKAFFDAVCLDCQKFIKDDSLSIQDLIGRRSKESGSPLHLEHFVRWSVGQ